MAARWTLRQVGVVRARCEEFDPDDLAGEAEDVATDPQTGEKVVMTEADLLKASKSCSRRWKRAWAE